MNNIFKAFVATTLITNINCVVLANSDPTDYSALTGEFVSSNPGLEIAVPKWTEVDTNGNGVSDGYNFHFNVFRLGTQTKLFSTADKFLAFYPKCIDGNIQDGKDILFKRIGDNIVMQANFNYVSCPSTNATSGIGQIYTVDISSTGKTPWVKSFTGKLIATGILPDTNANGVGELSVTIETGTTDNSFYVYDGETGVSLATPQKYAIER